MDSDKQDERRPAVTGRRSSDIGGAAHVLDNDTTPSSNERAHPQPCEAPPGKLDHVCKHEAAKHALGSFQLGVSPLGLIGNCDCP